MSDTCNVGTRSRIALDQEDEVRYWTRHLGVTREQLQDVIDKVGRSTAAVRKELKSRVP